MVELDSISELFKKGENGKYFKNNAELAKKILSYVFVNQELKSAISYSEPFRDRDLASWLLRSYLEFINDYRSRPHNQMNPASKVNRVLKRIKNLMDDLCDLDLIKHDKVETIIGTTDTFSVYCYIFLGYIIALFIELTEPGKRDSASQKLYDILDSQLSSQVRTDVSSYAKFNSLLFKKYMQKGIFYELLNDVFLYRLTLENEVITKDNLFASIDLRAFADPKKAKFHAQVLLEALKELEPYTKLLFFHDLKLKYQEAMRREIKFFHRDFERQCFKLRELENIVVLETRCQNCDAYYLVNWRILDYIERSNLYPETPVPGLVCPECNQDNCIAVPLISKKF